MTSQGPDEAQGRSDAIPARVRVNVEDAVADVVLAYPEKRNALGSAGVAQLYGAFDRIAKDPTVRVALLRGEGSVFCAGYDLQEGFSSLATMDPSPRALVDLILGLDKPVVAAVEGSAIGFGATLVLCADWRILSEGATLRWPEVSHGVPAALNAVLLSRYLPENLVLELLWSGAPVTSDQAAQRGLANEVVEQGRADERGREVAANLAKLGPRAVERTKRAAMVARSRHMSDTTDTLREILGEIGNQ